MERDNGEIRVFNPDKDVAREVTLNILVRHRDATQQAREGIIPGSIENSQLSDQEKKVNKVKGLYKMISAQREMVNISRPIVKHNCYIKWKKKNPTQEEKEKKPFENEENDYKKLMIIKEILKEAELDMVNAEQTPSSKDDYLVEKQSAKGNVLVLTPKYFDMINGLEDTYEEIDLIMLRHKIISAGIDEDEVKSYREQEKEAVDRIINA